MRRVLLLLMLVGLAACTLNMDEEKSTPQVVTATLGFALEPTAAPTTATPAPQIVILSSPQPTASPSPSPSATLTETPTTTPVPSATPIPVSSETPQSEATVEAIVAGTINAFAAETSIAQTQTQMQVQVQLQASTQTPVFTPAATAMETPAPTGQEPSETPSPTIPPTFTPVPTAIPPTRTIPGPPTVLPLDDGSGNVVAGTGSSTQGVTVVAGVEELPETLYYLSEAGGVAQVWRLRIGFSFPEQLTFSLTGVSQFDVAPDGTLAYITSSGEMIIDGIPVLPAGAADGPPPLVTGLAWSPGGDWLAYTHQTPGAADSSGGEHPYDGLSIQGGIQGTPLSLEMDTYGEAPRIYSGPIHWRPDGSEVLVKTALESGTAYSRVNITNGAAAPLWNTTTLLPGSYSEAQWNVNGNAIIASGSGTVLKIEPDTLAVETLLSADAGLNPAGAQQFANGTVTFVGGSDARQLYVIPLGQGAPVPATDVLTSGGRADFVWDNFGQQTLIVVYDSPEAPLGTAYLRDENNSLADLTALTGPAGSPMWGPTFLPGDLARIHTTEGDSLNVRSAPGGEVLTGLVNASRVTITGGPELYDGHWWWRVQTPDGISGWAVESVTDDRGQRLRTLIPLAN